MFFRCVDFQQTMLHAAASKLTLPLDASIWLDVGVYFAWKLGRLYGVRYTLAPYLYIIGMFTLCSTVAPMKWSKYTLPLQDTRSALRAQIARVIGNQEAVVAQKGSNAEVCLFGDCIFLHHRFAANWPVHAFKKIATGLRILLSCFAVCSRQVCFASILEQRGRQWRGFRPQWRSQISATISLSRGGCVHSLDGS